MVTGARDKEVGDNVRRLRVAAGLSQAGLAQELTRLGFPCSQQTVLKIEKGTRGLKLTEAAATAEILGTKTEALLSFETSDAELRAFSLDRQLGDRYVALGRALMQFRQALHALQEHVSTGGLSEDERERSISPLRVKMLALSELEVVEGLLDVEKARALGLIPIVLGDPRDADG